MLLFLNQFPVSVFVSSYETILFMFIYDFFLSFRSLYDRHHPIVNNFSVSISNLVGLGGANFDLFGQFMAW